MGSDGMHNLMSSSKESEEGTMLRFLDLYLESVRRIRYPNCIIDLPGSLLLLEKMDRKRMYLNSMSNFDCRPYTLPMCSRRKE